MKPILLPLSLVLLLAACSAAQPPWKNTDLPKEQWARDWSACKRFAERRAGGYDGGEGGSPLDAYDRIQIKRRVDAEVASCMIDRGYVPEKKAGGQ
ncbi:MAG: hypothetical protein EPN20_07115 [Magnetospirillum sp.]|nr:MAG: hypothetical protein EPN20_07115 [Magnetospirillum sp.]